MKILNKLETWGFTFRGKYKSEDLNTIINEGEIKAEFPLISKGNGRSYFDQSLNESGVLVDQSKSNKILNFDTYKGIIECQSGVVLANLLKMTVPKGWLPSSMPGTKMVTIGGMIASNIHGKNHHKFGGMVNSVLELKIYDGKKVLSCSRDKNSDLFYATIGGLGLTGTIISAVIQLKNISSSKIKVVKKVSNSIENIVSDINDDNSSDYVVTWLDIINKRTIGITFYGNYTDDNHISNRSFQRPIQVNIPFINLFSIFINRIFVSLFNKFYIAFSKTFSNSGTSLDKFFFPLDSIGNFNKIYGRNGLIQFHCIVPTDNFISFFNNLNKGIKRNQIVPTLSILKKLKKEDHFLSFPIDGFAIAIDFKRTKKNKSFVIYLNKLCSQHGGRVYLTKDSTLNSDLFNEMYNKKEFEFVRQKYSLNQFQSSLSNRLQIL
jgi:decaprenylphospho-beta-D-ribofuranose 2-oxidase